ncbi:Signal transduction histidine kinase [hydrothermal vent metagenome]|uniref:histidine kinase n=1 Tax=hydrothermal vent metagenome TaxID=652676 RepID=A0A3B0XZX6_9ZZZZ
MLKQSKYQLITTFMDIKNKKIKSYWIIGIGLSVTSILFSQFSWQGSAELHTLTELLATVLALFVGLLALIRFYSRGGSSYLVLGAGFIGVGMLDGYHAVVSSIWFKAYLPSDLPSLIPWSWLASRIFLSAILLSLYFIIKRESENKDTKKITSKRVFSFIFITTLCSFIFFAFTPLPNGYFNNAFFNRPEELIPATLFLFALFGFIKQENWQAKNFSDWLIIAIIVNLITQFLVMPYSNHLFDIQFNLAHLLKIISYICILYGLSFSAFNAFQEADIQTKIRKKAQISLEASEIRNRTMMNSLADGLILINETGVIENINNAACKLFGYSKLETLGKNIKILMSEPYHSQHDDYLSAHLKPGKENIILSNRKVIGLKKDGSTFPMELSVSKMKVSGKQKYSGIIRDDTQRLQAENELISARDKAQIATEAKSNFLATMSHEIRTPMNGVLGMIELLQDTPLNAQQKDIIKTISDSGSALLDIINDILEYSKVEAGKVELELFPFNLERTVYDVTRLLQVKAEEKNIELIFYYHTDCPQHVIGDAGRIRQIILNLVGNAIKFTENGQVMVEVKRTKNTDNNYNTCIEITDTGVGIKNKDKDMLFESFTQADNTTSRKYGGTGLGLSICKQLINLMEGTIDVKSELGDGSMFWFELFLEESGTPKKLIETDLNGMRILIVDNNPINVQILKEQLIKLNMIVSNESNTTDVIPQMLSAHKIEKPYNIVIINNMMPELNGADLGHEILNHNTLKNTPLVLLTSATNLGDAAVYKKIGFASYLTKPILSEILYKTLKRVLGLKHNEKIDDSTNDIFLTRHTIIEDEIESKNKHIALSGKVLLVEDMIINQKVALGLMERLDLKIDIANNGKEAVEKHSRNKYDIILMDCQMPTMDGFEATKIIRETDTDIPIIAVTANVLSSDKERCNQAGMNDHLSKPFNRQQLVNILSRWLNTEDTKTLNHSSHINVENEENNSINYETLSQMKKTLGSVFDELIPAYINQSDDIMKDFMSRFNENDIKTIERYAHSMKSSSLNLGAETVSEVALKLENMCRNNTEKTQIHAQIVSIIKEYNTAKNTLLNYHDRGNKSVE